MPLLGSDLLLWHFLDISFDISKIHTNYHFLRIFTQVMEFSYLFHPNIVLKADVFTIICLFALVNYFCLRLCINCKELLSVMLP